MKTRTFASIASLLLACLSLVGCGAIPMMAPLVASGGSLAVQAKMSSGNTSDAGSSKYVLQKAVKTTDFINGVRTATKPDGYGVSNVIDNPNMTMVLLSKNSTGLFTASYVTVTVTLQPDGQTVTIAPRVFGNDDSQTVDGIIAEIKTCLDKQFRT